MIFDSIPWKVELLKTADMVESSKGSTLKTERSHVRLEKAIFLSAYAIRKLIESRKLSDSVVSYSLTLQAFPARREVGLLNAVNVNDNYERGQVVFETRGIEYLCNQIIHSFSLAFEVDEADTFSALLVSSDRDKSTRLLRVPKDLLLEVLRLVGNDHSSRLCYAKKENGKEEVSLS